jgi:uncharacterized glyoxalase superfamily protein PhnB
MSSANPKWSLGESRRRVVDDVDAEYERLIGEGVAITTPIQTEGWGERYFRVADPCGVVIQLVQWMETAG